MRFDRWIGALYGTFTNRATKATSLVLCTYSCLCLRLYLHFAMNTIPSELYEMSIDTREKSQLSTLGRTALDDFKAESTHMCVFPMVFHPFVCIQWILVDDPQAQ